MNTRAKISYTVLTLLLLCRSTVANALSPQEIAKNAFNSTVLLVMEDANGQPFGLGSGFFVDTNQIATNLHVVEGAAGGYAKLVGKKKKHDLSGITAIDAERDLVILEIKELTDGTLIDPESNLFSKLFVMPSQLVSIADSDAVQVGEPVYAVGNPHGLEGTFSQGIISSVRKVGTDRLLQITAPVSPGSSGGPVLNGRGKVIGISVATFHGGQNLNFAIPSNYLTALLTQVGDAKPFSQAKLAKSRRSILGGLGSRSAEGVTSYKFAWSGSSPYRRYSFSLRNRLRQDVKNIHFYVIFYDNLGAPIDVEVINFKGTIPAGLARRQTHYYSLDIDHREISVEFRILDFEIVEGN